MNTPGKFNAIGTQVIFKSQDPHFHVYRIFNLGSAEMEVSYTDSAGNHAPSAHSAWGKPGYYRERNLSSWFLNYSGPGNIRVHCMTGAAFEFVVYFVY
jgi:hypothetical protein